MLDPGIQKVLDGMNAVEGPPAHEVPIEQARAGHEQETEQLSGPGEDVAEVRDDEVATGDDGERAAVAVGEGGGRMEELEEDGLVDQNFAGFRTPAIVRASLSGCHALYRWGVSQEMPDRIPRIQ